MLKNGLIVKHRIYGEGSIVSIDDINNPRYIVVDFKTKKATFVYPFVFYNNLQCDDKDIIELVNKHNLEEQKREKRILEVEELHRRNTVFKPYTDSKKRTRKLK